MNHEWIRKLEEATSAELSAKVQGSLEIIDEAFRRFGRTGVALSFNGGKDCTVLLHLLRAHSGDGLGAMVVAYFKPSDSFAEVEQFVLSCEATFGIRIWSRSLGVRDGLSELLSVHPEVQAVMLGTRSTDPGMSGLGAFEVTDPGWPKVVRVMPILQWRFSDVWDFLIATNSPYCSLYDYGYTSLGGRSNTLPNPTLLDPESGTYRPASELEDEATERSGRRPMSARRGVSPSVSPFPLPGKATPAVS